MSSQRARNVSPKEEMRRLNYDDITNEDTSFYDYAARLQTGGLDSHIDMTLQEMAVGNSEPEKKTMCESAKFRRIKSLTLTACFLMGCSVYLGFAVYLNPSESVFVCIVGALIFMFSVNALASGRFFSCIQRYATKVKKCVKLKNSRRVFVRR
ncbi:hypothetical protein DPMN_015951 [Dreissena polymorpha]|uniref:Uncharacterized protein n=1 Tax=Dreissena polymorpha TaxID=45954 RepID=A0A9D4N8R7_DREPO|nr:hypothetical protein DPMN_015951 [Dreissena polymorpha]